MVLPIVISIYIAPSVLCLKLLYEKNKKEKNINKTVLESTHM